MLVFWVVLFRRIDATLVVRLYVGFVVASFLRIDATPVIRLDVSLPVVVFLRRYASSVARLDVRCKTGVSNVLVTRRRSNGGILWDPYVTH